MANRPAVLLADEPTGNLDEETARAVFAALVAVARETAAALLIATHNAELAERADGIYRLHNGIGGDAVGQVLVLGQARGVRRSLTATG